VIVGEAEKKPVLVEKNLGAIEKKSAGVEKR